MLSSPRVYDQIWTPDEGGLVLAIIVRVDDSDNAAHFEADVTTDRLEVEKLSAQTLDELKALLESKYGRRRVQVGTSMNLTDGSESDRPPQ